MGTVPGVRATIPCVTTAAIVLFVRGHFLSAEGTLLLREREGVREATIREHVERLRGGAVLFSQSDSGDQETVWVDDSFAAQRMEYTSPESRSDFRAVRQGNTIRIHGMIRGRETDRSLPIDARPWLGIVELSLAPYVRSQETRTLSFWVVDSSAGEAHLLSVEKVGRERIMSAGIQIEAIRLKMTVPGLPALFWSAPWWFRASDGVFLRHEMAKGMPGTPKTLLELIAEE